MYHIYPDKSYKKKIRGQSRKFNNMKKNLISFTSEFPEASTHDGYWHLHVPTSQTFIDSYKTPASLRRKLIQLIADRVQFLINSKSDTDMPIRVVGAINLPNLFNSQIIVFFGDDYYKNFFNRDTEYQKWTPLPKKRSICKEWNLTLPSLIKVQGYTEEINDDDFSYKGELWFIGELN